MPAARHTPEQKAAALAAYREFGAGEASRRTGISRPLISMWAKRASVTSDKPVTNAVMIEAARHDHERWSAETVALLAKIARDRAEWVADQKPDQDAVKPMTVMAIAIDKAQLLSGKATQRVETIAAEEVVAIENIVQLRRVA